MLEWTLSIVKPDAVRKNLIGDIVSKLEKSGLSVAGMKMVRLNADQAELFYSMHKDKPFYGSLVKFMTSGHCVAMILEGENAIAKNREIMGATDPAKADPGTIRKEFGADVEKNAVHGSDSPESAQREIAFFFNELEKF